MASFRRSYEIVAAVLQLARALKLEVVAEGVETEDQAVYLQALGCPLGQGFHFAGPMPAKEIEKLLASPSAAGISASQPRLGEVAQARVGGRGDA